MSFGKRGGNVTPQKPKAAKAAAAPDDEGVTSVTVQRSFTIPGDGEYESQKVGIIVSAPNYEQASALCEQYMTSEFERSSAQFAQFRAAADEMAEELGSEDVADEDGEEGAEEEGGDLTADDVRAMTRKQLEELNAENDLGLKPTDYAKNKGGNAKFAQAIIDVAGLEAEEGEEGEEETAEEGEEEGGELTADDIRAMERSELLALNKDNELGLKTKGMSLDDLREAIIEAAGLEDGEGGEEAEEGEEAEDGVEEEGEEAEGGDLTADDVRAMSRKELIALNKDNELGIKSKNMSDEEFAEAVIEAAGLEDSGEEEGGEEEGEEGEEEEPGEEEPTGYTRKELEALKTADLKAIYKEWGIKDKYPAGAEPVARKAAINRIMQFQDKGK